jgi:hypothetical protein
MPYNVEPHVALDVLTSMVRNESLLSVFYSAAIAESNGVTMASDGVISAIRTVDGREFQATVFVDSSCVQTHAFLDSFKLTFYVPFVSLACRPSGGCLLHIFASHDGGDGGDGVSGVGGG